MGDTMQLLMTFEELAQAHHFLVHKKVSVNGLSLDFHLWFTLFCLVLYQSQILTSYYFYSWNKKNKGHFPSKRNNSPVWPQQSR